MSEYICHYLLESGVTARRVYHAEWYYAAMAMHNAAMPNHANQVVKWVTPEGLTIHTHDPSTH